MDKYEIGTRLFGNSKQYIKSLRSKIIKEFNLGIYNNKRFPPPHVTFFRPFCSEDESGLVSNFKSVLSKYSGCPINYKIKGFGFFDNPENVFYAKIEKDSLIEKIIFDLENNLKGNIEYLFPKVYLPKEENKINLHCSIIPKGANLFADKINAFLEDQKFEKKFPEGFENYLLRFYLLKNNLILQEFDFSLNKSLNRVESLDPDVFDATLMVFGENTGIGLDKNGFKWPLVKRFSVEATDICQ